MKLTAVVGVALSALCAMVAASPIPGGPHGGTPAACHLSRAQLYEKQGNSAAAAKERKLASEWRMRHYKGGGHKRRSIEKGKPNEDGPMTNMCLQAKAVSLQNHGNPSGAAAIRSKINQAQLKKESDYADSTAVRNHAKEGWKDTSKKKHH